MNSKASCELVFFMTENQVMLINGKCVDERVIFDWEPEKMASLVTNGYLKISKFEMYRNACKDYAQIHGALDEVRQQRYERVVQALELLAA